MNLYAHLHDTRPRINLADMLTERPQPVIRPSRIVRDGDGIPGPVLSYDPIKDQRIILAMCRRMRRFTKPTLYMVVKLPEWRIKQAIPVLRARGDITYCQRRKCFSAATAPSP